MGHSQEHKATFTQTTSYMVQLAYASAIWAFLFAASSFYWAAGGRYGASTLGDTIAGLSKESWFIAVLWLTGSLKLLAGALVLLLVWPPKRHITFKLVKISVWAAGFIFTLYGGANLVVRGLMSLGILATPEAMHSQAAYWHLILWDPYWLLGGILFLSCAWFSNKFS